MVLTNKTVPASYRDKWIDAAFDFGETFLYPVPDSGIIFPGHLSSATLAGPTWLVGGTAGPEASILDFLVLLSFFYVFHRLFPASPVNRTEPTSTENGRPPRKARDVQLSE